MPMPMRRICNDARPARGLQQPAGPLFPKPGPGGGGQAGRIPGIPGGGGPVRCRAVGGGEVSGQVEAAAVVVVVVGVVIAGVVAGVAGWLFMRADPPRRSGR